MNKLRWCFLIGSPDISGGSYVIFNHALFAIKSGHEVTMVTEASTTMDRLQWFPEATKLDWQTYGSVKNKEFDVVIATWWKTIFEMHKIRAKYYVYFVQSIESRFYSEYELPLRKLVDSTYTLPLFFITEAKWIQQTLEENYNKNVTLVRNGIRKDIYYEQGDSWSERIPDRLRILVEGAVDVPFKNVPKTIKLCRDGGADEIWLLTPSPIRHYEGVDRVFSQIPIHETPKIYRSCDVVVKLSYVEGMFGPPLEIFHCGGTSITYDVTGHDEYIVNGYNGVVIPTDHENEVVKTIRRMKGDKAWLNELKSNARITADEWIDWNTSSEQFLCAIEALAEQSLSSRLDIEILSKFMFDYYVVAENYRLSLSGNNVDKLRSIKEYIRTKCPKLFAFLKKIKLILLLRKR